MRFRPTSYPLLAALSFGLLTACVGPSTERDASIAADTTQHGDTALITTHRPAALDTVTPLVSDVTLDQPFGQILSIAATADGGVLVFDRKWESGPSLLRFSSDGELVAKIGRDGAGPGEYAELAGGLVETEDGSILLQDWRQARVNRYDATGTPLNEVRIPQLYGIGGGIVVHGDGSFHVPGVMPLATGQVSVMVHLAAEGEMLDTLFAPPLSYPAIPADPFAPRAFWSVLPDGRLVTALSDRLGIAIGAQDGSGRVIAARVEGSRPPARYLADELDAYEKQYDWYMTYGAADFPDGRPTIPVSKQEVSGLIVDVSGRIWLRRTSESIRIVLPPKEPNPLMIPDVPYIERARYLGFTSDGAFVGELELPPGIGGTSFAKDQVWMSRRTPDGDMVVSRYRIPWE